MISTALDNINISRYNSGQKKNKIMTTEYKVLNIPEKKDAPNLSRRSFLKATAGVLVATGSVLLYENYSGKINRFLGTPENNSLNDSVNDVEIANKKVNKTEGEELLGTIREIQSKYGVYIPSLEGEFSDYQVCLGTNNELIRCGEKENSTQITKEEAVIIKEGLDKIPSPGRFVQMVIPFRKNSPDVIGGGSYLGYNWDYFLDPSKYQDYPKDRYLSNISAVQLFISDKKVDSALPPVTSNSNFLPLLSEAGMNQLGLKATNRVDYPWTTYGERLKQVVIHEIGGHGVDEYASRIKVKNNPRADYEASAMSLFGGIPLDTNNPVISSFAKVNGWKPVPYSDFLTQWGDYGKEQSDDLKRKNPKRADWPVWDRDTKVWGELGNRNIRLDPYASYGTVRETFATFFMFYTLSKSDNRYDKSLLTKEEIKYFDGMFKGLSKNPEGYIKTLIEENPGPTFSPSLFESENSRSDNKFKDVLYVNHLPRYTTNLKAQITQGGVIYSKRS